LVQASDGNLYGTTPSGGLNNFGAVFRIDANGSLTMLNSFTNLSDGSFPSAGLVQASDGNLYGTTESGGSNGYGTVFRIATNGFLSTIYSFTGLNDAGFPWGNLVQARDGELYGTTQYGGTNGQGQVFRISTEGILTTLYSFSGPSDGGSPFGSLLYASDGNLYGTSLGGGANSYGTIFRMTTSGQLTTIYSFDGADNPLGGLIEASDGNLYGTVQGGGTYAHGMLFRLTSGGVFTILYSFSGGADGAVPQPGLVQDPSGDLCGTTYAGGTNGAGTVFRISTNGTVAVLYSFSGGDDGANPRAGLVQARDGNLYGTTSGGGGNANGTVFRITTGGVLTTLYSFADGQDAGFPTGFVRANSGDLYAVTVGFADNGKGTVLRFSTNGTVTRLYSFAGTNDTEPAFCSCPENKYSRLIQADDGDLYGTTPYGNSGPTIFRMSTNGALSVLCYLEGPAWGGLLQTRDGLMYGTTSTGGDADYGTVFTTTTNGVLRTLHSFDPAQDGAFPEGTLVLGGGSELYGTTPSGGPGFDPSQPYSSGNGTIFRITTNGDFSVLHSFTGGDGGAYPQDLIKGSDGNLYGATISFCTPPGYCFTLFRMTTNGALTNLYLTEGSHLYQEGPSASLVNGFDGNLYGTSSNGGDRGFGMIFRITADGTFIPLYSFMGLNDGLYAATLVQASDGNLYGISRGGGSPSIFFRLTIAPGTLVRIESPQLSYGTFGFTFQTVAGHSYTIQQTVNLASKKWLSYTNVVGDGSLFHFSMPINNGPASFFRIQEP
jgi:uncharacterized repeat protein (TIGR03803 family)